LIGAMSSLKSTANSDDAFQGMRRKRIVLKCVVASELRVHMFMMHLPAPGCYILAHNTPASIYRFDESWGHFQCKLLNTQKPSWKKKKNGSCIHG